MAEFCLACLSKLDGRKYGRRDATLSKELDLCEGCGEWKRVVVRLHPRRVQPGIWPFKRIR